MSYTLIQGDCLEKLKELEDNSVDSIVTDPPAGIAFMSKEWDKDKGGRLEWIAWMESVATECIRVLKPGGHALVWSIPRTSHWTGMAWENAGFTPRDKIYHAFGSGFPKSQNISKAIDKKFGAEREVVGKNPNHRSKSGLKYKGIYQGGNTGAPNITAPATDEAKQWDGFGTALKPAIEEWWLFRKPLSENTIVDNVLKWGTGALNIDGCRIEANGEKTGGNGYIGLQQSKGWNANNMPYKREQEQSTTQGRFPANLIHDGSEEVVEMFPQSKGMSGGGVRKQKSEVMPSI
ncbi:MAG: DNA methyltransferase, partial [bacterium]